jgi:hypothetical protein
MWNVTNLDFRTLDRLIGLLVLAAMVGCGNGGQATVRGAVKLNGEPLKNGTIAFVPSDGATASAEGLIRDGSYSVVMPPGKKTVRISAMKVIGRRQVYEGDPNSPVVDNVQEMIPPQYNAASTLTVNASPGSQKQDFDLQAAP